MAMKSSLLIKIFLILPLIMFVDYVIMLSLGCTACLLGFGDGYVCGTYCIIGKVILLLSAIFFIYLIYPDLYRLIKTSKHGAT